MIRQLAVFSIAQNDPELLDIWAKHYINQTNPSSIYILNDNNVPDLALTKKLNSLHALYGINVLNINNASYQAISKFQNFLIESYHATLFAEIDEIIFPQSDITVADYTENLIFPRTIIRCCGYEVVHQLYSEPDLDFAKPILTQRKYWCHSETLSKPLLSNIPINWSDGCHKVIDAPDEAIDRDLILLKLHKIDYNHTIQKIESQGGIPDRRQLAGWFVRHPDKAEPANYTEIPNNIRILL